MISNIDKENMYQSIKDFPSHLKFAYELVSKVKIKNMPNKFSNLVISGMGGSAIGGDVVSEIVKNDIGILHNKDGSLNTWASQGVLLLNSCLTVEVSKPGSHFEAGWGEFIKEIIYLLNKKNNLVFFLWGKNAQKYIQYINSDSHLILTAAHPSPLSAHKGFFGCKHFSKCNDHLKKNGINVINW